MRRSPKFVLVISVLALAIGVISLTMQLVGNKSGAIYVVDVMRLFNEFKMKRAVEATTTAQVAVIRQQMDSITAVYKYIAVRPGRRETEGNQRVLEKRLEQAKADIDAYTQKANEQIWTRLNSYVEEYGKKHNARVIIGANGLGSVMYNDQAIDVTDEILLYVNARYEGKNN